LHQFVGHIAVMSAAICDGDVVSLYLEERGDGGFLAADSHGVLAQEHSFTAEKSLLAPAPKSESGELTHPLGFQERCLFRLVTGRSMSGFLTYGQPVCLVHAQTGFVLCSVSANEVELRPMLEDDTARRLPPSGFFFIEPLYKLRSEGEHICVGDHVLLQSRRFAGSYLHTHRLLARDRSAAASEGDEVGDPRGLGGRGESTESVASQRDGGGDDDAGAVGRHESVR